ncbi:hypothetical protein FACS1894130_03580 [Spirochaetia bacterium]|nr:hypothetical protein FACS1894130_03580 [Spirochaetia bacterium]
MNMKKETLWGAVCVLLTALALLPLVLPSHPWPALVRDTLAIRGYDDTGAPNLVAAMYLGYRAYDTLGELVVLLAALTAAIGLIRKTGAAPLPREEGASKKTHTEIINVTAGKLSPMVLLFGWYLMFYGYQSPGGGFQGGVVLASGIIFIALGRREEWVGRLNVRRYDASSISLGWIEAVSFLMILLLCIAGPLRGFSILENPFPGKEGFHPAFYITGFNICIGLKVGSGIAMACLFMMEKSND